MMVTQAKLSQLWATRNLAAKVTTPDTWNVIETVHVLDYNRYCLTLDRLKARRKFGGCTTFTTHALPPDAFIALWKVSHELRETQCWEYLASELLRDCTSKLFVEDFDQTTEGSWAHKGALLLITGPSLRDKMQDYSEDREANYVWAWITNEESAELERGRIPTSRWYNGEMKYDKINYFHHINGAMQFDVRPDYPLLPSRRDYGRQAKVLQTCRTTS